MQSVLDARDRLRTVAVMPRSKVRAKVAAQRKKRPPTYATDKFRFPQAPWLNWLEMRTMTDDADGLAVLSVLPFGIQVDGEQGRPSTTHLKWFADTAGQSVFEACQYLAEAERNGWVWWDQQAQVVHPRRSDGPDLDPTS